MKIQPQQVAEGGCGSHLPSLKLCAESREKEPDTGYRCILSPSGNVHGQGEV